MVARETEPIALAIPCEIVSYRIDKNDVTTTVNREYFVSKIFRAINFRVK